MQKINDLKSEPLIGTKYLVPCVYSNLNDTLPYSWLPVLTPSHEDFKYFGANYLDKIPKQHHQKFHHFHGDPRFTKLNQYTKKTAQKLHRSFYESWFHFIIHFGQIEYKELTCLRAMPKSVPIYSTFGDQFVNEFKNKSIQCGRCPHKGTNLENIPIIDGAVTCPAHGLKFDSKTRKCLI